METALKEVYNVHRNIGKGLRIQLQQVTQERDELKQKLGQSHAQLEEAVSKLKEEACFLHSVIKQFRYQEACGCQSVRSSEQSSSPISPSNKHQEATQILEEQLRNLVQILLTVSQQLREACSHGKASRDGRKLLVSAGDREQNQGPDQGQDSMRANTQTLQQNQSREGSQAARIKADKLLGKAEKVLSENKVNLNGLKSRESEDIKSICLQKLNQQKKARQKETDCLLAGAASFEELSDSVAVTLTRQVSCGEAVDSHGDSVAVTLTRQVSCGEAVDSHGVSQKSPEPGSKLQLVRHAAKRRRYTEDDDMRKRRRLYTTKSAAGSEEDMGPPLEVPVPNRPLGNHTPSHSQRAQRGNKASRHCDGGKTLPAVPQTRQTKDVCHAEDETHQDTNNSSIVSDHGADEGTAVDSDSPVCSVPETLGMDLFATQTEMETEDKSAVPSSAAGEIEHQQDKKQKTRISSTPSKVKVKVPCDGRSVETCEKTQDNKDGGEGRSRQIKVQVKVPCDGKSVETCEKTQDNKDSGEGRSRRSKVQVKVPCDGRSVETQDNTDSGQGRSRQSKVKVKVPCDGRSVETCEKTQDNKDSGEGRSRQSKVKVKVPCDGRSVETQDNKDSGEGRSRQSKVQVKVPCDGRSVETQDNKDSGEGRSRQSKVKVKVPCDGRSVETQDNKDSGEGRSRQSGWPTDSVLFGSTGPRLAQCVVREPGSTSSLSIEEGHKEDDRLSPVFLTHHNKSHANMSPALFDDADSDTDSEECISSPPVVILTGSTIHNPDRRCAAVEKPAVSPVSPPLLQPPQHTGRITRDDFLRTTSPCVVVQAGKRRVSVSQTLQAAKDAISPTVSESPQHPENSSAHGAVTVWNPAPRRKLFKTKAVPALPSADDTINPCLLDGTLGNAGDHKAIADPQSWQGNPAALCSQLNASLDPAVRLTQYLQEPMVNTQTEGGSSEMCELPEDQEDADVTLDPRFQRLHQEGAGEDADVTLDPRFQRLHQTSAQDVTLLSLSITSQAHTDCQLTASPTAEERPTTGPASQDDSFDRVPQKKEQSYAFTEVVRKQAERKKLKAFVCWDCEKYYKTMGLAEGEVKQRMAQCSRHRARQAPPSTPEHFWSIGFPDTPECEERQRVSSEKNRRV